MSNGISTWIAALALLGGGCAVEGAGGAAPGDEVAQPRSALRVLLHDAPTDEVEEVWVEVSGVRVHGEGGWSVVSDEPQALDLLSLQGGVAAELGLIELPPGEYGQLRLDVTDSWVIAGGERRPLRIPSGGQSGLKIQHGFTVPECGTLTIALDWDAGAHLHHNPGQGFILRPVLEVSSETVEQDDCDVVDAHVDDAALFRVASDDVELYVLGSGDVLTYGTGRGTIISSEGLMLDDAFPDPGHRVALWVPPGSDGGGDVIVGGYDGLTGMNAAGALAWRWDPFDCCNVQRIPAAVDPATAQVYFAGKGRVFQRDVRTGASKGFTEVHGDAQGHVSLAQGLLWKAGTGGRVSLFERTALSWGLKTQFTIQVSDAPLRAPAIASDGSAIVSAGGGYTAANQPGDLVRVTADRSIAWRVDAGALTPPVVGAGDVVFVGASPADGVYSVDAYSLAGDLLWSAPVVEPPSDLAVGDDGVVYAAAGTEILGFDQATGELALRYHGLSAAAQILLQGGRLYVSDAAGAAIYALPVPATGYDPAAPWPVRYHDNQRTSSL